MALVTTVGSLAGFALSLALVPLAGARATVIAAAVVIGCGVLRIP